MKLENDLKDTKIETKIMRPSETVKNQEWDLSENENQEQDLDMLIFGNPELPSRILNHLPAIE